MKTSGDGQAWVCVFGSHQGPGTELSCLGASDEESRQRHDSQDADHPGLL